MPKVDDLRQGLRARISPRELAELSGRSQASLARDRWNGTGCPFQRDDKHRIWYRAEDVLNYLMDIPIYGSTSEYSHDGCDRMAHARTGKDSVRQSRY